MSLDGGDGDGDGGHSIQNPVLTLLSTGNWHSKPSTQTATAEIERLSRSSETDVAANASPSDLAQTQTR